MSTTITIIIFNYYFVNSLSLVVNKALPIFKMKKRFEKNI